MSPPNEGGRRGGGGTWEAHHQERDPCEAGGARPHRRRLARDRELWYGSAINSGLKSSRKERRRDRDPPTGRILDPMLPLPKTLFGLWLCGT